MIAFIGAFLILFGMLCFAKRDKCYHAVGFMFWIAGFPFIAVDMLGRYEYIALSVGAFVLSCVGLFRIIMEDDWNE